MFIYTYVRSIYDLVPLIESRIYTYKVSVVDRYDTSDPFLLSLEGFNMTQRITSCTVSEVPERLCTSSMDALRISPFTDTLSNKTGDVCRIEHTQFGEVYICRVCNVKCTGKAPFSQHISGSHHRKNCNASKLLTSH